MRRYAVPMFLAAASLVIALSSCQTTAPEPQGQAVYAPANGEIVCAALIHFDAAPSAELRAQLVSAGAAEDGNWFAMTAVDTDAERAAVDAALKAGAKLYRVRK
jgi:hypothetical protein